MQWACTFKNCTSVVLANKFVYTNIARQDPLLALKMGGVAAWEQNRV